MAIEAEALRAPEVTKVSAWRPMKDAPTGVPIVAKHEPNKAMPHGWIATILLGHDDEEEPGSLDIILHYNGDVSRYGFHGCWDGWMTCEEAGSLIHRSALAEDTARAAEGWEPIETAPKGRKPDGTMQFALLCAPYPTSTQMWSDIYQCWWKETEERWMRWPHPFPPTLWMPSPAMPEGKPSGSSIVLQQLSDEEKRERAAALADARKRERSALPLDKEAADANR